MDGLQKMEQQILMIYYTHNESQEVLHVLR